MAQTWAAKAPGEVVEREWAVPVGDDDSVASYTASVSGATLDSDERDGDSVILTISAGSDGATAIATLTATTANGLVLAETFYLPVRAATNAFGYTVREVCDFALRKVVGNGASAEAAELDDATERLSDMLAAWAGQGADLGVKLPCAANDVLYVSDAFASAIKNSLIVELSDLYGVEAPLTVARNARAGLQQIKTAKLPSERDGADFY